jgi:type II secretory pathway pseudopilin PulG
MLKPLFFAVATLALIAPAAAQNGQRTERVQFARGTASKAITGAIKGDAGVRYLVGARAGQKLTVTLKTSNASSYFNVTAPGADAAVFIGSSGGNRFTFTIPSSGDYAIDVYLMRNAARRGETAKYTLTVGVR